MNRLKQTGYMKRYPQRDLKNNSARTTRSVKTLAYFTMACTFFIFLVSACSSGGCRVTTTRMDEGLLVKCEGDECANMTPVQKGDGRFACPIQEDSHQDR